MVEFVNCFSVPAERVDSFVDQWRQVNAYMIGKPGYVSHRLHRAVTPDATYKFVNVATWDSAESWREAHDAGFRAMLSGPEWTGVRPVGALYDVVHEGAAS